jgi:hypothetical protein
MSMFVTLAQGLPTRSNGPLSLKKESSSVGYIPICEWPKAVTLITNALAFAGPRAAESLLNAGFQVAVHDIPFVSWLAKADYRRAHPQGGVPFEQSPAGIGESVWAVSHCLDVLVSNDASRHGWSLV